MAHTHTHSLSLYLSLSLSLPLYTRICICVDVPVYVQSIDRRNNMTINGHTRAHASERPGAPCVARPLVSNYLDRDIEILRMRDLLAVDNHGCSMIIEACPKYRMVD